MDGYLVADVSDDVDDGTSTIPLVYCATPTVVETKISPTPSIAALSFSIDSVFCSWTRRHFHYVVTICVESTHLRSSRSSYLVLCVILACLKIV
jgi:hypothetical protein